MKNRNNLFACGKTALSRKFFTPLFVFLFVFATVFQGFSAPAKEALAAAPAGSVLLFGDEFEQTGNLLSENEWNTDNWVAVNGDRIDVVTTASGDFNVGVSGKGIRLDGINGSYTDEGAQRDIATKGYGSLYLEYSRAFYQNGNESGDDEFAVSYSLDGGVFQTIATTSMSASAGHFTESATIPNPDRNTKLTLRFSVNGDVSGDPDMAAVDNVKIYGSLSPIFYDGFEGATIESGGWLTEEGPTFTGNSTEIWTDGSDDGVANGKAVRFLATGGADPDQAIESNAVNTTYFENVKLRYSRGFDSSVNPGENFSVYYSTTTPVSWILAESVTGAGISPASVSFSLPPDTFANPNLKLRFEINGDFSDDVAFLDDVVVWGEPTTALLTVTKIIANDNGGTATTSDFALFVDGFSVSSGVASTTSVGLHAVSEANLPGYAAIIGGDCAADGTITLAKGDIKNCTITNDDITPTLTVIKNVINDNGGTATSSDFTMTVTGDNVSSSSFAGASAGTTVTLNAGTYSADEVDFYGYAKSSSADCNGVIALGENKVCTITNDDIQPKLTVTKVLVADNGGNESISDFALFVNAASVTSGVQYGFNAGTYTVSESGPSGYDGPFFLGNCNAAGSVTLAIGDVKECTMTNDDISPRLTVIKQVINDNGGTATSSDFTMTVNATNINGTGTTTLNFAGSASGYTMTLNANAPYGVDEVDPLNYLKTTGPGCSGALNEGENASCTITNDDQMGTLRVRKVLVNNNGGTATSSDFSFSVNGGAATAFESDGENNLVVNAGTYTVSETATSTYATTYNNCSNVLVISGGVTTCTIRNNDIGPTLALSKGVINDNGGTAVKTNWLLSANGPSSISGNGGIIRGNLQAGLYTLSESGGPQGYTAGEWRCRKNGGAAVFGGSIRLSIGDAASCSIINDDQPAALTIIKKTKIGSGDGNFDFSVTGTASTTGFSQTLSLGTAGGYATSSAISLNAGTYDVTETIAGDWALFGVSCLKNGADTGTNIQNGKNITAGLGDNFTCTFTDTRLGTLVVRKVVKNDNEGAAGPNDFAFKIGNGSSTPFESDGENRLSVLNGTYSVTEVGKEGYTVSYDNCSSVAVPSGGEAICTITNDDIPPPASGPSGNGPIFGSPVSYPSAPAISVGGGAPSAASAPAEIAPPSLFGTGGGFLSVIPTILGLGGGEAALPESGRPTEEIPGTPPEELASEGGNTSGQTAAAFLAGFFANLLGNWIFWLVAAVLAGLLLLWFFREDNKDDKNIKFS